MYIHSTGASQSPTDVCPPVPSGTCKINQCCSCNSAPVMSVAVSGKWAAQQAMLSVRFEAGLAAGTRINLGIAKSKGFR